MFNRKVEQIFIGKYHDGIEREHGRNLLHKTYKSETKFLLKADEFTIDRESTFMTLAKEGLKLAHTIRTKLKKRVKDDLEEAFNPQ